MTLHAMPSTVGKKFATQKNKINNDAGLFLYLFHKYMNKFCDAKHKCLQHHLGKQNRGITKTIRGTGTY